jgi:hypothetical protein
MHFVCCSLSNGNLLRRQFADSKALTAEKRDVIFSQIVSDNTLVCGGVAMLFRNLFWHALLSDGADGAFGTPTAGILRRNPVSINDQHKHAVQREDQVIQCRCRFASRVWLVWVVV